MKILVVMKRFGANKDMVIQDFGRQIRLFENLKQHKIDFLCPDYTKKENKDVKLHNMDFYIRAINITNPFNFLKDFNQILKKRKYDVIVATTTPIIGFISYFFSKKYKIKLLYDLQDNYEIYDAYKTPFFKYIDKYVTKKADAVICVSNILKSKVKKFRKKPIYIIENGVEINLFKSMPKLRARKILKLPTKSKIIVYIGHISNIKGFDILYEAFKIVKEKYPNTYLLLSGKIDKNIDIEIRGRRDYIIINLLDSGIGFKNKKTKDLIKPYFTTKEKGTGLGLSIVDKIISDHNGSINFINQKNGAKIQIIIPNK
jgi:glycosyltransferase involved in cell wall biosynthesis